jgi:hypothetical protein
MVPSGCCSRPRKGWASSLSVAMSRASILVCRARLSRLCVDWMMNTMTKVTTVVIEVIRRSEATSNTAPSIQRTTTTTARAIAVSEPKSRVVPETA